MAERTHRVATVKGASFEYDYDDVTGEIVRVRGVNDGAFDLRVRVTGSVDSGAAADFNYEHTFPANSGLTEFSIPPGQRKRFTLEPDGRGPEGEGEPDFYPTLRGITFEVG